MFVNLVLIESLFGYIIQTRYKGVLEVYLTGNKEGSCGARFYTCMHNEQAIVALSSVRFASSLECNLAVSCLV